jgi:beta-1,4-N-acetylglucosaminyltransferase
VSERTSDFPTAERSEPRTRVLLVCSSGGHLAQLHALRPWWSRHDRTWVTFDTPDARELLRGERILWAHYPTTRHVPNLLRNTVLSWRVIRRFRPNVVVSDGAGVALPFFLTGRLFGARTVYVEVYDRVDSATLTGRLCYPLSDLFLLQWKEQRRAYPRGVLVGRLL